MEAAISSVVIGAPVPQTTTPVEDVMETKGTGINKSNLDYVVHHYGQAIVSLDRAQTRITEMTGGKTGRFANSIKPGFNHGLTAHNEITDAVGVLEGALAELRELYS